MLSLKNLTLHEKPYFHFPNVLKKWSFQKKSHWNMLFLISSGKIIFLFPENMILLFRQKVKDNLSQKNRWKYNIFFKGSEKIVFPKKSLWDMAFLFPEHTIFLQTESERWSFSKYTSKYDVFCIFGKDGTSFSYKYETTLLSKKQRWSSLEKLI